ncbi:uncharacterized protein isoform X1 [Salmo salar]|uniref:Uncharacterized protein LOC106605150 isoform X1 n=1 Tax=Salmo salar TaxID=8030 RepID=A0ABM3EXP2_SALSA|nr:uncharacterized protein LOC106605150 isoform X1 [Salmo salar]XP_045575847.1 uncharacterized protein LOC106605150 isoform X1 [Salmo salar]XP_045575855.1 uncharacterized protein LOC106605150 isoform X1 [Salmo salar]
MVYCSLHFITFNGPEYSFKALRQVCHCAPHLLHQLQYLHAAGREGLAGDRWTGQTGPRGGDDGCFPQDEVHCTSVSRCAAVYAWGLHVVVWRVHGGDGGQQLAALVEVPQTFCNHAVGLLGLWSSNHTDDFLQSDGKLMIFPNNNPPPEESLHPFGLSCNMPPIVTEPTVIRCKFKSTVHVQISTQDAYNISFSMLFPRPPQASVGKSDGILTWTPLDIQPVYLTIRVNDQLFSSQFAHILQFTCQYDSIVDNHLQGRFQTSASLPSAFGITRWLTASAQGTTTPAGASLALWGQMPLYRHR